MQKSVNMVSGRPKLLQMHAKKNRCVSLSNDEDIFLQRKSSKNSFNNTRHIALDLIYRYILIIINKFEPTEKVNIRFIQVVDETTRNQSIRDLFFTQQTEYLCK